MSNQRDVFHGVLSLQHGADRNVHSVRSKDEKHSRELQRGQVHRICHVHNMHCLARFCSTLLRIENRLPREYEYRRTNQEPPNSVQPVRLKILIGGALAVSKFFSRQFFIL